jgi:hypothetical protein
MMVSIFFGIAALASIALIWGGIRLIRIPAERRRGLLMIAMAVVIFGNILIWAVPV